MANQNLKAQNPFYGSGIQWGTPAEERQRLREAYGLGPVTVRGMKEEEEKGKDLQRRAEQGYNIYQGPTGSQAGFEAGTQAALAAAPAAVQTGNPYAAAAVMAAAGLAAGTQAASKAEQDARKARAQQAKKEDAEQLKTAKAAAAQLDKEGEMAASAFEEDEDVMLAESMYDPNAGESQYTKWYRENFA